VPARHLTRQFGDLTSSLLRHLAIDRSVGLLFEDCSVGLLLKEVRRPIRSPGRNVAIDLANYLQLETCHFQSISHVHR
jgi:hypothetical protein